jgi:hypothetical protein
MILGMKQDSSVFIWISTYSFDGSPMKMNKAASLSSGEDKNNKITYFVKPFQPEALYLFDYYY